MLKLGVIASTKKENEQRVPIHPDHLTHIPENLRPQIVFEKGYFKPFGGDDSMGEELFSPSASRQEILESCDLVLLAKPLVEDLKDLREHGTLWGWPHCVQQRDMTQIAIDRKLTLIAFEGMFAWGPGGQQGLHTFYRNNEMAGYCSVLDAMRLQGIDGRYGPAGRVAIMSFGSVSRGAIYALQARGFTDITVCVQRPEFLVREKIHGCHYVRLRREGDDGKTLFVEADDGRREPLIDLLAEMDIIVNGIFQDPDDPIMFVGENELGRLRNGCLIVDVSCDEAMGFFFAKPTTFNDPMFAVEHINYYAVDHSPSYLWKSSSWEISKAVLRYLPVVLAGPEAWEKDETIRRAIEIQDGVVKNPKILSFQKRSPKFPHRPLDG